MTVTQNRCHTHLGQAVLQRYVFIPCCRADFQPSFPSAMARGRASRGRGAGHGVPSCYGFSRPDFFFFLSQSKKPHLCWWLQPPSVLWPRPCSKHGVLFKYVLVARPVLSENFQCLFFSNPVRFLRAFRSQFQALCSLASFYLLLLIVPRKRAFPRSIFFKKCLSCIFQYRFSCTTYQLLNYPQGLGFLPSLLSFYHEGLFYQWFRKGAIGINEIYFKI